jgi:hypothetical protein
MVSCQTTDCHREEPSNHGEKHECDRDDLADLHTIWRVGSIVGRVGEVSDRTQDRLDEDVKSEKGSIADE